MSLLGRAWIRATALLAALLVAGCAKSATPNCGGCPGDALVTTGLVRAEQHVTAIRVCVEGACRSEQYEPGYLVSVHLPATHRLESLEVSTLDGPRVVGRFRAADLDLPAPRTGGGPCACHARNLVYDPVHARFRVERT